MIMSYIFCPFVFSLLSKFKISAAIFNIDGLSVMNNRFANY